MSQRAGDATASAVTPVILTRALEKVYAAGSEAEVVALKGVDVRILPGEFVAIMGPSGSGKSTLMNLIGCLDTPTAGSYACDGVDLQRASAALAAVGLHNRGGHLPSELSGGQQQRVAIARALINRPPLLLADEPTGALDSKTGEEILALFKRLRDEGHTVVLITHDAEVAAHCDRVLVMKDGELHEGTLQEGLHPPQGGSA